MDNIKIEVNADGSLHEKPELSANQSNQNKPFLSNMNNHEISRVFTDFSRNNRFLVVPIGFPQAGKSLLLSSLMYYARKGEDVVFRTNLENNFPFDNGRLAVDEMVNYFDSGKLYGANRKGTLDLIGINIEPSRKDYPPLKLGFLDLAGEDIKNIKTSEGSSFTENINAVFNGLKIDDSPVIFVMITPFDPPKKDNETARMAHSREDALHYDFLNYIKQDQPQLLKNSKFFIVVSQWDLNYDDNLTVEDYIRENRPSVYAYVKNANVVWGEYSVGKLLVSKVNGVDVQEIVRINYEYPSRFWKKLYSICTNKDLDQKKWWEKLF
jgi:hypothetical protein